MAARRLKYIVLMCVLVLSIGSQDDGRVAKLDFSTPDERLFDHASKILQQQPWEARTLLETLVASYPDSRYCRAARALLRQVQYPPGYVVAEMGGETVIFFPSLREPRLKSHRKVAN